MKILVVLESLFYTLNLKICYSVVKKKTNYSKPMNK